MGDRLVEALILYRRLQGGFFARRVPLNGSYWSRNVLGCIKAEMQQAPALRRAEVVSVRVPGSWYWPPLPTTPPSVLKQLAKELDKLRRAERMLSS
jgi:hypothetical protein